MNAVFDLNAVLTPVVRIKDQYNQIDVKREDLLPFSFGGNKVRIAFELISDMYQQGKNCMIGYGNARSNLSRALANLCYKLDIPCHIISPADEDATEIEPFNRKIALSCDAQFHYCRKTNVRETVEKVVAELYAQGLAPYYSYGDPNGKGNEHIPVRAYKKVYKEMQGQYDYIFLAVGTGMTYAGLLAGKALNSGKENIIGISIARAKEQETEIVRNMLYAYSEKTERIKIGDIHIEDAYICGGYGKYNCEIERTIKNQMRINGLPLDPTYTGKAFWGMQNYIRKQHLKNKKILFIHTGGTPLYFDYERNLRLVEIKDKRIIEKALVTLEKYLKPSLKERNIDLKAYAGKLFNYGKVWCHMDADQPVSIIAGYANDMEQDTAYFTILAVSENYRRKMLGTALLSEFECYAEKAGMRKIKFEVRKHNKGGQRFYMRNGYRIIGEASATSFYMGKILAQS